MIKLNDTFVELEPFPDGTLHLSPNINEVGSQVSIVWKYQGDEEMAAVMFLKRHLDSLGFRNVRLEMPYIPNARQDRVKDKSDVFTLKYFAEFINSLNFSEVVVLDPHSSVSEALFNNIRVVRPIKYIHEALDLINATRNENNSTNQLIAFFPDEGAMKRYSSMSDMPYAFGIKERDWKTGRIEGLSVISPAGVSISGNDVLIIDDISSKGGTFYYSAQELKSLGAKDIYLYITHCEESILYGEIFRSGLIERVFTTNSIFDDGAVDEARRMGVAEKIHLMNC